MLELPRRRYMRLALGAAVLAYVAVVYALALTEAGQPLRRRLSAAVEPWLVDTGYGVVRGLQVLRGDPVSEEFSQDWGGARGLLDRAPVYGEGGTTHPPTAFLLALPLAQLPYAQAQQIWAIAMLTLLFPICWAFGARWWQTAVLAPFVLLWPPSVWSIHQLTPVWLLGLALAWRFRAQPRLVGGAIGVAALTKFLPAVSLLAYFRRVDRRALLGFAVVVLLALVSLLVMDPAVLLNYLTAGATSSAGAVARADNGALLIQAIRLAGIPGVLAASVLILIVARKTLLERPAVFAGWSAGTWLGVALLPIAWTYSLLPLLPGLLYALRRGSMPVRFLAVVGLLLPVLWPVPTTAPLSVAATIVVAGISCLATAGSGPKQVHSG